MLKKIFKHIENIIINFISSRPMLWLSYTKLVFNLFKIRYTILIIAYRRRKIHLQSIFSEINSKNKKVCHILGNGMSINESIKNINNKDYVIAINSGAILPVRIDLFITELHGKNELTHDQLMCNIHYFNKILSCLKNKDVIIFIKNMWFGNVSPNIYDPNRQIDILPEYLCRHYPENNNDYMSFLVDFILNHEMNYIAQTYSTVLTAVNIAYKAGFQEIFIHGLDGKGSHFFHSELFDEHEDIDLIKYLRKLIPPVAEDKVYTTGSNSKKVMDLFITVAKKRGVTITLL